MIERGARRPAKIGALCRVLLVIALFAITPQRAFAKTIDVTTTDDELNDDGDCSLREAIQAANVNQAKDACPAGDANKTDTIALRGGVFALTVVGTGVGGDLDIGDNPAALDVSILSKTRRSTIQQTVESERVIEVGSDASLRIQNVTITGGTPVVPDPDGGGIRVGARSALALQGCTVSGNTAFGAGGGIFVEHDGTLDVIKSVISQNRAGVAGGGGIASDEDTFVTVATSRFIENASSSTGGAIQVAGAFDIALSAFVNNRANNSAGALISSRIDPAAASVTQSCFVGNAPTAVLESTAGSSITMNATGNWWAALDGPSGSGPGSGDAVGPDVDFSGFLAAPPATCSPLELVANGGFEAPVSSGDSSPARWILGNLEVPPDGRACDASPACDVAIAGDGEGNKLSQTIKLAGVAGDTFRLSARSKADLVPLGGGRYRAELTLIHTDGSRQFKRLNFATGTHDFQALTKDLVASEAYSKLKVKLLYSKASGAVRFDDVSVVKQP